MSSLLAGLKRLLRASSSLVALPLLLSISLGRLLRHGRALRSADWITVALHAGFGHTVTGPDVTRRLFPGKRSIFLLFSDSRFHNSKLPRLWRDPVFIALPLSLTLAIRGRSLLVSGPDWGKDLIRRMSFWLVRVFAPAEAERKSLLELYDRLPLPEGLDPEASRLASNYRWPIGYFKIQERVPAPALRLPAEKREAIQRRLGQVLGSARPKAGKLCNLYLRQKRDARHDPANTRRSGSPIGGYLPAVGVLNQAGYQVLVTGDVPLPAALSADFSGMLVDAATLGMDKEWVDLYAGTEADIFIGEPGGGVWLPGLNGIPRLLVNAFPYFFGLPNSWVYYKTVYDATGSLVHYSKLFREHAHDYDLPGMTLKNNTPDEILEAVISFLEDLRERPNQDPHERVVAALPDFVWTKQAGARFSTAWFRLFDLIEREDRPEAAGPGNRT